MPRKGARNTASRSQDRERIARMKLDQIPRGRWRETRLRYPAKVRALVDRLATGGMSLMDVAAHSYARFLIAEDLVDEVKKERKAARDATNEDKDHEAPGLRSITMLEGVAARYLDQLRQIALAMGPALSTNEQPVVIPEGMDSEAIARVLDGVEPSEILD